MSSEWNDPNVMDSLTLPTDKHLTAVQKFPTTSFHTPQDPWKGPEEAVDEEEDELKVVRTLDPRIAVRALVTRSAAAKKGACPVRDGLIPYALTG